jgi:hypothetical protein
MSPEIRRRHPPPLRAIGEVDAHLEWVNTGPSRGPPVGVDCAVAQAHGRPRLKLLPFADSLVELG